MSVLGIHQTSEYGAQQQQQAQRLPADAARIAEKIGNVYTYVAEGFAITVGSALVTAKLGYAVQVISLITAPAGGIAFLAVSIGLLMATKFTSKENLAQKHGLYCLFAVSEGVFLSPLVLINPAVFAAASATTVAVTAGLGYLATTLKESFERYEKILMVALTAIAAVSFGALVLPAGAAAFAHEVSLIGGLALFSAFVIYDTHKVRSQALDPDFSEIDHATGIYLDVINLFVRIYEVYERMTNEKKT